MERPTKIIPVQLSDGTNIRVEAALLGEQRVASKNRELREATDAVKSIASEFAETLQEINKKAQPDRLSVKLGIEIAVESGQLTALLVKGAGKANLEITMEWGQ